MSRYVLIDGDDVVTGVYVSVTDEWLAENASAITVDDAAEVAPGYTYDSGTETFTAPTAPDDPVPVEVTMRQARLELYAAGILQDVEDALDALDEPNKTSARIEWDYASVVERNSSLVAMLSSALGLSESYVDALFVAAEKL